MTDLETRFTTEGLVVREMIVGESDRLVTILTREHGLIKAFASGAKNINSKKGAATALLTYSEFCIKNKNGSLRIFEATPKVQFFKMGADIMVLSVAQYFCELALMFGESGVKTQEFLRLILNSLHFIVNENKNIHLVKAITELRTAVISGYMPDLVACKGCGCFEADVMYFDITDGSLTCKECGVPAGAIPINKTQLSALRHIAYSEFKKLYSFDIPEEDGKMLSSLTEKYISHQTDYNFASLKFLNSL